MNDQDKPSHFSDWEKKDLVAYLDFLMHNYRVMDAFWFINIEKKHGLDEACLINELVWGKVASLAARDLKEKFGPFGQGLDAFLKALALFPWTILVGYDITRTENEVILEVPSCPPQEARLKRGLGEYSCQAMHQAEFQNFVQAVDSRIQVECLFAPPDDHPPDCFCRWKFTLAEND